MVSAIVVIPASILMAYIFLYFQNAAQQKWLEESDWPSSIPADLTIGYGSGDIAAFAFWSIGLSIVVFILTVLLTCITFSRVFFFRVVGWIIAGPVSGFLWTLFAAFSLGPWVGAFSFPILYCWIGGASLAVTAGLLVRPVIRND